MELQGLDAAQLQRIWRWACFVRVLSIRGNVVPIFLSVAAKLAFIGPLILYFSGTYTHSSEPQGRWCRDFTSDSRTIFVGDDGFWQNLPDAEFSEWERYCIMGDISSADDEEKGYSAKDAVDGVAKVLMSATALCLLPWLLSLLHCGCCTQKFDPTPNSPWDITWNQALKLKALSHGRFAVVHWGALAADTAAWGVIVGLCGDYTTRCDLPQHTQLPSTLVSRNRLLQQLAAYGANTWRRQMTLR